MYNGALWKGFNDRILLILILSFSKFNIHSRIFSYIIVYL